MRQTDQRRMEEALRLAQRGEGLTRPNPPVGALVVKGGRVVGRGYHRKAGGAHAEIHALRQAGPKARGATLYVTLEPCSSWGRTPPCTDAIIKAGISRVVAAMPDPDPRHRGSGFRILRRAGIKVSTGAGESAARELLKPFASRITRGLPFLTLKLAVSLDGKIADRDRRSKWITGTPARRLVQDLRRKADAILVGVGTAIEDDPSLLPRPARGRRPFRVIVDSTGRLPLGSKVARDGFQAQTILAVTERCPAGRQARYRDAGLDVWVMPSKHGRVALGPLMRRLAQHGALRVLCEGGGELAAGLADAGLIDELILFMAPILLGGKGVNAVGGDGWPLKRVPRFRLAGVKQLGSDIMIASVAAVSDRRPAIRDRRYRKGGTGGRKCLPD